MMAISFFLPWIIIVVITPLNNCLDQASFYGNSFISIPLKEANGHTDINFKFRTYLPDALIFLVAGTTDYCILRLDDGRLKLNINVGSGEFEISSPQKIKLNDLNWHEVIVTRREANLSLIIDKNHVIKKKLPGKFFELNIQYGLFVGGRGNFSDIFFGHQENFRGCLADLVYNGIAVLDEARRRQSQTTVVRGITWNCGAEFDADASQPISFVNDGAYLTIVASKLEYLLWQFELKTLSEKNAVILYNMDLPTKRDCFSLELWKGKLRLILKLGDNKIIDGTNDIFVADGHWHKVVVHMLSSSVELHVDSLTKTLKILKSVGNLWEISDVLYVGGVDVNKRIKAASKGLKMPEGSFKGCIRSVKIGDRHIGLRDARATEGLLNGCVWQFPCLTSSPCNNEGVCVQEGLDSYRCICKTESCTKANHSKNDVVISRGNLATDLELLMLEPLQVVEGQSVLITSNNLYVVLDHPKYGVSDSGVIFHIVEAPEHGSVMIDVWPHEKNSFTLSDISRDKVYYVHDGSEHLQDRIIMEMEFSATDVFILPVYLQGRFRLTLLANITPINDPPILNIPNTAVLRLARGMKRVITRELLHANDPDSPSNQLVYNIIDAGSGHLEYLQKSRIPISSFTQEEIDKEQIVFVHHSSAPDDSYLSLRVSDGIESSKVAKLRISAFSHYWRIHNNTGLIMMHDTSAIITCYNLSFISNVPNIVEEAQYYVVQEPQFGVVEVELSTDEWKKAVTFTSEDIRRHRVRYHHIDSRPNYDEFQFRTSLNGSAMYTFRITYKDCDLIEVKSQALQLHDLQQSTITEVQLKYKTVPITTSTTSILFVVTSIPQYGYLFLSDSKYKIDVDDTFMQEDVIAKNINYRLNYKSYSNIHDSFFYSVIARGCKNITGNMSIIYSPSKDWMSKVKVTLQRVHVEEGAKALITTSNLNIVSNLVTELQYNLTLEPLYGYLQVQEDEGIRNNTKYFTSHELLSQKLSYIHDDSETTHDIFNFVAYSKSKSEDFQYANSLHIDIKLKNDNKPVRVINKVFNVVVNSQKLLTGNDLKYSDADLNTDVSDLIYTFTEIPNGELYDIKNLSKKITEFSQKNLDDGVLLFKHHGAKYAKIKLWVTDVQFYVEGVLEVQASAPFVTVRNNKKLITQHGKWAVISNQHLSIETNLYAFDSDIIYEIISEPIYGRIITSPNLLEVKNFTQIDVNNGQVFYVHEEQDTSITADRTELRVRCKDAINVTQLNIWMLPPSYWNPIISKHLKILTVEESTSAIIDRNTLEVSQADDVPAGAITYLISQYPNYGYLSIVPVSENDNNESVIVTSFTQALINENRLVYVQSRSNETTDMIVFNVTNNMVWLYGVVLEIEIIPEHLYLGSGSLTVDEGGRAKITESQIYVQTEYYKSRVIEYTILQQPLYGWIESYGRSKSNEFTHEELVMGVVQYMHDNSENLKDEIIIIAVTDTKRSLPVVVPVIVVPINDQEPQLINNTGLTMWEGGSSVITSTMLATIDLDYPLDTLTYQVLGSWWGNVSLTTVPNSPARFFTQEFINKGFVIFHHQNGSDAKFTFNVSDGLHSTGVYSFHIKTKPVVLHMLEKSTLHVFPLQKKHVTTSNLLANVSDTNRSIHYRITNPPLLGRLLICSDLKSNTFQVTNKFTQEDINNKKVFYEHTHPFEDLYAEDIFTFSIEAHLAVPILNEKFKIDISVSSGGLDAYITVPQIKVDEGGITNIKLNLSGVVSFLENHAGLKSPIIHSSCIINSMHGQVFLEQSPNLTTFTQEQLENGQVHYQHDHSDTLQDFVYLSLYLIPGYIILCNITVPIEINSINDQPFKLITPAPHFTVVQGENHTITPTELCTEDADTIAAEIHYDIITGPSEGQLILLPESIPISHFSQKDINEGKLIYIHDGFSLTDVFHLRVWDGKFRHDYTVLNIQIRPISLNISTGLPLYLQQGSNVILLSRKQFVLESNADLDKLKYVIKDGPKHGLLYVKDAAAIIFKHTELQNDQVMYMQTDMTTANDSLKIFASLTLGNTTIGEDVDIFIIVQPLMQIRNFTAVTGTSNRLSIGVLDAGPLAKLTNSNPRYTIIASPKFGQVRKMIRSSGETRNVLDTSVMSFTHEEVQSGLIYLITKNVDVGWGSLEDELSFILAASIFQPAVGKLKIIIKSTLYGDVYSTLASPSDPAGREGGMHLASPNMTRDYFLIVSMVVGVIILGVTVIVIIKCRTLEPDLTKEEQSLQPIPLPRPPDTLMATPSPIKQHVQDSYAPSIPTTLPQCKVTPLNETHTRYPYGIEEHLDDWSSCDASDPSCPTRNNIMLRRNQYWV